MWYLIFPTPENFAKFPNQNFAKFSKNGFELKDVFCKMCIIEIGSKRSTIVYNIMPLSVFDVARNLDFSSKRQSVRYLTTLGPSLQGGNIKKSIDDAYSKTLNKRSLPPNDA